MNDKYVDIYVCCANSTQRGSLRQRVCDDAPRVQRQGDVLTIQAQPAGSGRPGDVYVTVATRPRQATQYCDLADPRLTVGQAAQAVYGSDDIAPLPYAVVQFNNPDDCRWRGSRAIKHGYDAAAGPLGIQVGVSSQPSMQGGDAESEQLIPGAGALIRSDLQNVCVAPGEWIEPAMTMFDGIEYAMHTGEGTHFATACLAGGRVLDVLGKHGSQDVQYLVAVIGPAGAILQKCMCTPSDYAEWAIGDWVIVAIGLDDCDDQAMTPVDIYNDGTGSTTRVDLTGGIILPLAAGAYIAESTPYQPWPVPRVTRHPMGDVLALCLRTGTIAAVNRNGTMDIEMPWGMAYDVPAHYHCPEAATVAGGHTAFQPGDAVIVASTRAQEVAHVVFGFADGAPRPCSEYIVISTGIPNHGGREFYLVWDAVAGRPAADLPDGNGGVLPPSVFPCTRDVILPWLEQSRSVSVEDQMDNLHAAERLGWQETASGRVDAWPSAGRMCADLACDPPHECPWYNAYVDGERLGGHCGYCHDEIQQPNAVSGYDTASMDRQVTHQFINEEGHIHVLQYWHEEHPFIQNERESSLSRPPYSVRCVWAEFESVIQASRTYSARREVFFATDLSDNLVLFEEEITDRVTFPGVGFRPDCEWTEKTTVRKPAAPQGDEDVREWTWNDRTVTVNGFGLRTHRSWLFAYVMVSRRWWVEPYVNSEAKHVHPGFDIVVAAGSGSVLDDPLTVSPFSLPTDAALEMALTALVQAAFDDAEFTTAIHTENAFRWEVRS
ncbi:hypothetical protein [Megalodesulfovibrio gigas]|uniref:Uncharacterized protein n=1 Tax=Megalodesulfovibrio gigas (strain ATCC 19364 / DSM 1382 / NCIMB 9332 / VKM B-1759) TaxID=1121448 RepID=T2GCY9_MEGG1|nr:hypothetical protein [Megalodesulfovibrio gigas]AGW14153.1 hypothetical protein DGI_2404 [Megalodesulfovibrio gigas DSM 1382 = ATCC 19364]